MADATVPPGKIRAVDRTAVHRICSGQVVLNLATAIKELVENSLDAESTNIEIRLKEYGSEMVEVIDNGHGVEEEDFEGLALKHHTSKLQNFDDLTNVQTFGFRGEALSSLCALSANTGWRLEYDHQGKLANRVPCPRQVGTTVSLENLFAPLPVRQKEFVRNLRREFTKAVHLLTAYCLTSTKVRLLCTNQPSKGKKTTVLATQGNASVRDNILSIFGPKESSELLGFIQVQPRGDILDEFSLPSSASGDSAFFKIEGLVSTCQHGKGRSSTDRQFIFVNGRPCEIPKVSRLINDTYHLFNRHQYPFVLLDFTLERDAVDVNVTPDKRQVFLQNERLLLATIRASLLKMYSPVPSILECSSTLIFPQKPEEYGVAGLIQNVKQSSLGHDDQAQHQSKTHTLTEMFSFTNSKRFSPPVFSPTAKRSHREAPENSDVILPVERTVQCEQMPETISGNSGVPDSNAVRVTTVQCSVGARTSPGRSNPVAGISNADDETRVDNEYGERTRVKQSAGQDVEEMKPTTENMPSSSPRFTSAKEEKTSPAKMMACFLHSPPSTESMASATDSTKTSSAELPSRPRPWSCSTRLSKKSPDSNGTTGGILLNGFRHKLDWQQSPTKGKHLKCVGDTLTFGVVGNAKAIDLPKMVLEKSCNMEATDEVPSLPDISARLSDPNAAVETEANMSLGSGCHSARTAEPLAESGTRITYDTSSHTSKNSATVHFSLEELSARLKQKTAAEMQSQILDYRRFRARISPDDNTAAEDEMRREIRKEMFAEMEIIGQFNLGFIVGKHGPDLFIVDQHATDEKYNFEMLQKNTELETQKLVRPRRLELTAINEHVLLDNVHILNKNGFFFLVDDEAPPGRRVSLESVPVSRNWTFSKEDVDELVFMLGESPGTMCRPSRIRQMFASRACRKSVMIGTSLTMADMKKLVSHMGEIEQPWNCPHGRPTMRHLFNLLLLKE